MKQVKLTGRGIIFRLTDTVTDNCIEQDAILEGVALEVDGEDITKKKGKYLKQKFVHSCMTPDTSGTVEYLVLDKRFDFEFTFDIPVEDDEFNPKLIQLIKSDYEVEDLPYYIVTDKILYDGKEICNNEGLVDFGLTCYTTKELTWDDFNNMYM